MSLSQIRNRINALRRKYARELAACRLRRLADEFSQQWAAAVAERRPAPESHPFIKRVADHGVRAPTYMQLHKYLEGCRCRRS